VCSEIHHKFLVVSYRLVGIGSIVGLYNGFNLSKYHVSFSDKIIITLGGCFNGFIQGSVYCCYPMYPLYIIVYLMEEYNKEKRIYYIR
jgi:hypothetical protein